MPVVKGAPRSFHKAFKFRVEIDNVGSARFQKCSKLEEEIAIIEQFEGGDITPDKSPGRVKFTDVTLERGATSDEDLFNWIRTVCDVAKNGGIVDDKYKRTVDIVQLDRDGTTLRRYRLTEAWPFKRSIGDWDNDKDENLMESMSICFKRYDQINP